LIPTIYVSYDGALDPLGGSQIVPYVEGLAAADFRARFLSFEKPSRFASTRRESMELRLRNAGVEWLPLPYHKAPRVPATLYDCIRGARTIRSVQRRAGAALIHARGDVAALMARLSGARVPLLFDARGFFADERVDAGSWRRGSLLDRSVRSVERGNLTGAAQVVVLTVRAANHLRAFGFDRPITVIPTCVDLTRFTPSSAPPEFDLVYSGSVGGWYMTEEMARFVAVARQIRPNLRTLFLVNDVEAARAFGPGPRDEVRTVAPEDVPAWMARARASFFLIRPTFSKIASCPTKLAESLSLGLPVLSGPGIGDVDEILTTTGTGVLLRDFSDNEYARAFSDLQALSERPGIRESCRIAAAERLSLARAVERYTEVYRRMVSGRAGISRPGKSTEILGQDTEGLGDSPKSARTA
jgi:glycosyltransferase involved in cell wall biosynthesis